MDAEQALFISNLMSSVGRMNPNKLKDIAEKHDYHLDNVIEKLNRLADLYGEMAVILTNQV